MPAVQESQRISRAKFVKLLTDLKVCRAVSFTAVTVPRMVKTGNPYWEDLLKYAYVNGLINWQYENAVNNQRDREGRPLIPGVQPPTVENFEALDRSWGERQKGTPFIEHKGKLYIEVKIQKSLDYHYYTIADGREVPVSDVKQWLARPSESARQKVERPVILRDYGLETIQKFVLNGVSYAVR